MKIFVFGNSIVEEDSKPVKFIPELEKRFSKIQFVHADPTDQWWEGQENPIIIDTVAGLKNVQIFTALDSFEKPKIRITPHDYDLFMDIAFLLKLKKIQSFLLIGLPQQGNKKELLSDITAKIEAIFAQS